MFILDLHCEGFAVPGVDGPNLTSESYLIGFWMHLSSVEFSLESMTFTALIESTVVVESNALLDGCTAIILPKVSWVDLIIIVVSRVVSVIVLGLSIVKFVLKVHVTITD
jgi:hypothetical protein